MCQVMSLDTDVIPYLGADHAPDYLITHLAEVLQQYSQLLQHEQDDGHPPTRTNPPQPIIKSAAQINKADNETVVSSTAPIGEVSRERLY